MSVMSDSPVKLLLFVSFVGLLGAPKASAQPPPIDTESICGSDSTQPNPAEYCIYTTKLAFVNAVYGNSLGPLGQQNFGSYSASAANSYAATGVAGIYSSSGSDLYVVDSSNIPTVVYPPNMSANIVLVTDLEGILPSGTQYFGFYYSTEFFNSRTIPGDTQSPLLYCDTCSHGKETQILVYGSGHVLLANIGY